MIVLLKASILVLVFSSFSFSQEPVPMSNARWERVTLQAPKQNVSPTVPAKPIIAENKYFQRKAREQRTDNPMDPYEASIEGRSAAMEKSVQQSRTAQANDVSGYSYSVDVRNDTGKAVAIIFWEYRFTEIARPTNVVRRQFLCGTELKDGEKKSLSAFSTLAPSEAIDVESLAKSKDKLFNEEVLVNRIEFSDGTILQRHGWKLSDVKASVEQVTSTPWGTEVCRAL
jgi:hypothetical protein